MSLGVTFKIDIVLASWILEDSFMCDEDVNVG